MGDVEPMVGQISQYGAQAPCPRCAGEQMRMYRPGAPEHRLEVTSPKAEAVHPSGEAEPYRDDELITRRISRVGEIGGVEVLDCVAIGEQRWTSLARRGLLASVRFEDTVKAIPRDFPLRR